MNPTDLLRFVPEKYRGLVLFILALSPVIGRAIQALVNGRGIKGLLSAIWLGTNTPAQTPPPPADPNATKRMLPVLAAFIGLASLTGCTAWDAQHRPETIAKLKATATKFLAGPVLHAAEQLAIEYIADGKLDIVHVAADALWKNGGTADLTEALETATGDPVLADEAAQLVIKAEAGGITRKDAAGAIAAILSSTALAK